MIIKSVKYKKKWYLTGHLTLPPNFMDRSLFISVLQ